MNPGPIANCLLITCTPEVSESHKKQFGSRLLHVKCREGKLGSRDLRSQLGKLVPFLLSQFTAKELQVEMIVQCSSGNDIAVGVALIILCLFADDAGELNAEVGTELMWLTGRQLSTSAARLVDKSFIRKRLAWITSSRPQANLLERHSIL